MRQNKVHLKISQLDCTFLSVYLVLLGVNFERIDIFNSAYLQRKTISRLDLHPPDTLSGMMKKQIRLG